MEGYGEWIWDESEYNFFMSLGDISKLEYMYDFFNLDDDEVLGEFEIEYEDDKPSTTSVDVVLTDTHFLITCDNDEVLKRTVSTFKMDGYILLFQQKKGDTYFYEYVGLTPPFSIN